MQSENKMFDDFVKMVNGFAGTVAGMGREAESSAREKFKDWIGGMDFVSDDDAKLICGGNLARVLKWPETR